MSGQEQMSDLISIHALYAEGDGRVWRKRRVRSKFQSTPSMQRATKAFLNWVWDEYISIHALYAEGDQTARIKTVEINISIHALYAEGDLRTGLKSISGSISIHALYAEGDDRSRPANIAQSRFQSTPSMQRATRDLFSDLYELAVISIHALYAEGDSLPLGIHMVYFISIHALYAEGDLKPWHIELLREVFQSTPSMQRATLIVAHLGDVIDDFNPRPLCRGRRFVFSLVQSTDDFNPRPLCRGRPPTTGNS